MNWTDLQQTYMELNDHDKFLHYASDNKADVFLEEEADSYFTDENALKDKGFADIIEYDFFDIESIEKSLEALLYSSNLENIDILLRITAVAMLKQKPQEVSVRDRAKVFDEVSSAVQTSSQIQSTVLEKKDTAPPELYYPI